MVSIRIQLDLLPLKPCNLGGPWSGSFIASEPPTLISGQSTWARLTNQTDSIGCITLSDTSILKLAVAFPQYPGEEQLVVLPLSIPMGWVESPSALCVATETVADLANNHHPQRDWPEHPLEEAACTTLVPGLAQLESAWSKEDPLPKRVKLKTIIIASATAAWCGSL